MIEMVAHLAILIGLLVAAAGVFACRDLVAAAIHLGVFSLLLALEFYILQAPDVAIAEAGVGAGLTTAIYIAAIRATRRREEVDE